MRGVKNISPRHANRKRTCTGVGGSSPSQNPLGTSLAVEEHVVLVDSSTIAPDVHDLVAGAEKERVGNYK